MNKLIILFILSFISSSYATTFVPISAKEQVKRSDYLIRGIVISSQTEEHEFFKVVTRVEMRVEQGLGFGEVPSLIDVYYPGGNYEGQFIKIEGAPKLELGESVVLVLNNHKDQYWVSNLGLGKYSLKRVGEDYMMVNQIFPEHPEFGHIPFSRFVKIAENVKNKKFAMRSKTRFELEAEKRIHVATNKKQNSRGIASVEPAKDEESFPVIWLVFIFGALGVGVQFSRRKKS